MTSSARVRKHRANSTRLMRRVEVTVPVSAANDLRAAAKALREGGEAASAIREAIKTSRGGTHENAREFFERIMVHVPPGEPLTYERDQTTKMREIDL
jgi:hypothetical protein